MTAISGRIRSLRATHVLHRHARFSLLQRTDNLLFSELALSHDDLLVRAAINPIFQLFVALIYGQRTRPWACIEYARICLLESATATLLGHQYPMRPVAEPRGPVLLKHSKFKSTDTATDQIIRPPPLPRSLAGRGSRERLSALPGRSGSDARTAGASVAPPHRGPEWPRSTS